MAEGAAEVWPGVATEGEGWLAAFDERAGFLEFDCHLTRAEAEAQARADMGEPPHPAPDVLDFNTAHRQPAWLDRSGQCGDAHRRGAAA